MLSPFLLYFTTQVKNFSAIFNRCVDNKLLTWFLKLKEILPFFFPLTISFDMLLILILNPSISQLFGHSKVHRGR